MLNLKFKKVPAIIWRSYKGSPKIDDRRLIYSKDKSLVLEYCAGKDAFGKVKWEPSFFQGKTLTLELVLKEILEQINQ